MSKSLYFVDMQNVNNNATLFDDVIKKRFPPDLWKKTLNETKILRNLILGMVKQFIDYNKTVIIKEFSDVPPMCFSEEVLNSISSEILTDYLIIKKAFSISKIEIDNHKFEKKYTFVAEALDSENISTASWDKYLNELYFFYGDYGIGLESTRISKIIVEDTINILKKWSDKKNTKYKLMIEQYILENKIIDNSLRFWEIPFSNISKNNWEHFTFVLTINDFEIYDDSNKLYLEYISKILCNQGFFEEVVIIINHFYWNDNLNKIFEWLKTYLPVTKISFRFKTIAFLNRDNYFSDKNNKFIPGKIVPTNDLELNMVETKMPLMLKQLIDLELNVCGFELDGGYFGSEGYLPDLELYSNEFEEYKEIIKKTLNTNPFGKINDDFVILFDKPQETKFICIKGD